jgi:CCR4-NOT transcription complex subunit 9
LLQEIVSIYPLLTPPTLTAHASNRVCNALALLQCVASHADTRQPFLAAQIPLYLYPFLNTQSKSRPFEYLRLTSLGVIGALVKVDDTDVISFLLSTEIIPLCLRIMETGSELSKTVATFIVQKILLEDTGLNYVCATAERFYAVSTVLGNMVTLLQVHPSVRLLKHVVRCYLRLADHPRAREALKTCLPTSLRDNTFGPHLHNDPTVQKWLSQLLSIVGAAVAAADGSSGGVGVGVGGAPGTAMGGTAMMSGGATVNSSDSLGSAGMDAVAAAGIGGGNLLLGGGGGGIGVVGMIGGGSSLLGGLETL